MFIGKKVREMRESQGMKLSELAEKSGVQIATLSRIEHMKMVGSLESHMNIAKALGVDVTQLYKDLSRVETKIDIKKPNSQGDVFVHSDQSSYEMLTAKVLSKKMMPILLTLEPGGQTSKEQNKLGSEIFLYVLEGSATVRIENDTYPLSEHNSLYFDGALEHCYMNNGKSTVKLLSVSTPVAL